MNICSQLRRAACAVALSACAAAPVLAKDSGFYLGVDVGVATYDVDSENSGVFPISTGLRADDTDTSFTLAFGYRVNPYVGVEFAFVDYGEARVEEYGGATVTKGPPVTPATRQAYGLLDASASASALSLSVVGTLPLNKFELFARVGTIYAESKLDTRLYSTSIDTPVTAGTTVCPSACTWAFPGAGFTSDRATTSELSYGVGAGYTIAEVLFVKLEYSMVDKVGDKEKTGEVDISNLTLGFHYRF